MANNFEEKSDKTFESAELLVLNQHKNSSIHCYYYSCLQLMQHFLNNHYGYSESDIKNIGNSKESHNDLLAVVKKKFSDEGIVEITLFSEFILIKKQRVKADYGMNYVIDTEFTKKKTVYFREKFKSLIYDI